MTVSDAKALEALEWIGECARNRGQFRLICVPSTTKGEHAYAVADIPMSPQPTPIEAVLEAKRLYTLWPEYCNAN